MILAWGFAILLWIVMIAAICTTSPDEAEYDDDDYGDATGWGR